MRPILTPFLALYWTMAFAVLALVCADGGNEGTAHVIEMLGLTSAFASASPLGAALAAFGLAICAALFFWALVQTLLDGRLDGGHGEHILRLAFAGAIAMSCVLLVFGMLGGESVGLSSTTLLVAALAVSYVAAAAERWASAPIEAATEKTAESPARALATDAARQALLPPGGAWSFSGGWERPT